MIYLDNSATTRPCPACVRAMTEALTDCWGNPSSVYALGIDAAHRLRQARQAVAAALGAEPDRVFFTSGGTEANNLAVFGAAAALARRGKHIVTTGVEHSSVAAACKQLEKEGYAVTRLLPDSDGHITADAIIAACRPDTALVSVMLVNNETGARFSLPDAVAGIRRRSPFAFIHCDAVQAAGAIPLDVNAPRVDMMSISGHKFYGPKGVGALYIRSGVKTGKILTGGHQERGMRGGTTNVPGVVGMAEALRLAVAKLDENAAYISSLRDRFIARVQKEIPFVNLNGHPKNRLPSNANFSFRYVEGESLLFSLDLAGIAVSSGSACSSGSLEPSHVLLATGMSEGLAHGSLRFSFGRENTAEDVDYTVDKLKEIVVKLRNLSPLFPKDMKNEVFEKGE